MKSIVIRSILTAGALVATQVGFSAAFATSPATVINLTQTPCHFVDSRNSVASYHSTALIASRELFPQGITPEEQLSIKVQ